jgi:hypothetical protein
MCKFAVANWIENLIVAVFTFAVTFGVLSANIARSGNDNASNPKHAWGIIMNILEQVDDFWREALREGIGDLNVFQSKYADLVQRIGDQVSQTNLPDEEQARLIRQVFDRNAEYIAMAKQDRNALKIRLGLPASSAVDQLDDFYRECFQMNYFDDREGFLRRYNDLFKRLQAQVAHLPQAEQDKFFLPVVMRNAEYIAIGKQDKNALRVRLGVPVSTPSPINTGRLAQVAADTVVRATIWQGIAALFRAFRWACGAAGVSVARRLSVVVTLARSRRGRWSTDFVR